MISLTCPQPHCRGRLMLEDGVWSCLLCARSPVAIEPLPDVHPSELPIYGYKAPNRCPACGGHGRSRIHSEQCRKVPYLSTRALQEAKL